MADREFTNINGIKVCDQTARNSIPTKTSQLENDSNFVTDSVVDEKIANAQLGSGGEVDLSSYAKITDLPTKTSQLTNDSGYITNIPDEYITETELNAKGYATTSQIPTVPTNVSEFTNDANYASETYVTNKIAEAQLSGGSGDNNNDTTTTVEVTKDITVSIEGNTTIPSTASQQEVLVEFTSGSGSNNVPTFTNLITDTTTLQKTGVTVTTINADELEHSAIGQDKSGYFRFTVSNLTANHTYYCSIWAKSTTAFPVNIISVRVGNTTTDYSRFSSINTYASGTWYIGFDTGNKNSSDTYAFKKPLLIDLTELYGEGNEPTKEEFEAVLGDAWCLDTYSPSSSPLPSADFVINSYKSDDSLLDTFNSNSDTNIIIIGGGYVNVSGNSIPQPITLKNVAYTEQQTSGGSSVTTKEFVGIKWACIGDSLTDSTINATKKYHKIIANKTGITVQELARGGTGYTAGYDSSNTFYDRISRIDSDTDIVTLFGSVNDWKNYPQNSLCSEIGTVNDVYDNSKSVVENTFCANLNKTFDALFAKVPTAQVIVFGAMPYYGVNPTHFGDARKAVADVCANRHITYVDMFDATGFYRIMDNADYATAYTTDFSGTNYNTQTSFGHPNNDAHLKIIAPIFLSELRKHLPIH